MKKNNIRIFYTLAFLQGLVFYSSISSLYRTQNGITIKEMGVIEGFFSAFMILFEIPWGMLCDRIGYKKSMIISNFVYFLSKVIFFLANGFGMFLFERLLLAIASSGLTGCDSALLYLSIDHEDETTGVFGKYSMFGTIGMIIASLSFSLFFKDNLRMSAFMTIIPFFISFILSFFLENKVDEQKTSISMLSMLKEVWKDKSFILFLIASILFTDTIHTLTTFYNQFQYERAGIPIAYYGIVYMLFQVLGISSGLLGKITNKIKKEKICIFLYMIGGIFSILLIFINTPILSVLCLMVLACTESLYYPIQNTIENEHINVANRATMLSIYSMIMNGVSCVTSVSLGSVADSSLLYAYGLAGMFCITCMIFFLIWNIKCKGFQE